MTPKKRYLAATTLAVLLFVPQIQADLIVDPSITAGYNGALASATPTANDLPGFNGTLRFGQLKATEDGFVDLFYLGNEAGYVNSLLIGGSLAHSTAGLADTFIGPYQQVGSVGVAADGFVDFGFCTSGGAAAGAYGLCASNAYADSLTAQFNYASTLGYRTIGYRPLTSFDPLSGTFSFGNASGSSDLWMIFWDDSGAANDDDYDDYIAVGRFRPVGVPEPSSLLLLGAGLLGIALLQGRAARQRARVASRG